MSQDSGGFLYAIQALSNNPSSNVEIGDSIEIDSVSVVNNGTVFYIDDPNLSINFNTSQFLINMTSAKGYGGVFYISRAKEVYV